MAKIDEIFQPNGRFIARGRDVLRLIDFGRDLPVEPTFDERVVYMGQVLRHRQEMNERAHDYHGGW